MSSDLLDKGQKVIKTKKSKSSEKTDKKADPKPKITTPGPVNPKPTEINAANAVSI